MFSSNNNFFSQPSMPTSAPSAPANHGPSLNLNLAGGIPSGLTLQGHASMPVSPSTTLWAQGGNNMPLHPNIPTDMPRETQGMVGATFRLGK